ncbi:hypothetical protein ACU8KH_02494 [Lachancea thermotolerans]
MCLQVQQRKMLYPINLVLYSARAFFDAEGYAPLWCGDSPRLVGSLAPEISRPDKIDQEGKQQPQTDV